MKKHILFAAYILLAGNIYAQKDSLNAVIQVENDYSPTVIKATKQIHTPQIEKPSEAKPLDLIFSQSAAPFKDFVSERNVKEALPGHQSPYPGYARIGYGSNNNIDIKASYLTNITERDLLRLGTSLRGFNTELPQGDKDWHSRLYSTHIDAGYSYRMRNMTLSIDGEIKKSVFNYQPGITPPLYTDKQNSSSYSLTGNILSHFTGAFSIKAAIGYTLSTRKYSAGEKAQCNENHLAAGTTLSYEIYDAAVRNIGATIAVDGFIYNKTMKPKEQSNDKYKDYTSIRMNPFMNFKSGNWEARIGIHADILTSNGSFIAFAPDIDINGHISNEVSLFVTATGGRTLNTFDRMNQLSPYWNYTPGSKQYTATYRVCDVEAGTRISFNPLSFNIYAGYAITKDDLMPTVSNDNLTYTEFVQKTSRNLYAGARIGYDYGGWIEFAADARYNYWSCSGPDILLLYKPMLTIGLNAKTQLYEGLYATIGYKFEGYTKADDTRIKECNDLNAMISYKFHKQLSAYIQGNNLADSKHRTYPGYTAQGINFLAGISATF